MAGSLPLYEQIAALDEARTVESLVRRLKPILSALEYAYANGDSAVLDFREDWQVGCAQSLHREVQNEGGAPPPVYSSKPAGRPSARPSESRREPPAGERREPPRRPPAREPLREPPRELPRERPPYEDAYQVRRGPGRAGPGAGLTPALAALMRNDGYRPPEEEADYFGRSFGR